MKKIDTCALAPAARDEIRHRVIRLRQRSGMNATALAAIAGVHPGSVLKWLSWARNAGEGEKAMAFMTRLQPWPERVSSYFQHPAAQYEAQPI
jgi:transposase-like protein